MNIKSTPQRVVEQLEHMAVGQLFVNSACPLPEKNPQPSLSPAIPSLKPDNPSYRSCTDSWELIEGKSEGTDHFTDVKHQGTKYRKAKEIQSYKTSTTVSFTYLPPS